jgi:hypothetical protein
MALAGVAAGLATWGIIEYSNGADLADQYGALSDECDTLYDEYRTARTEADATRLYSELEGKVEEADSTRVQCLDAYDMATIMACSSAGVGVLAVGSVVWYFVDRRRAGLIKEDILALDPKVSLSQNGGVSCRLALRAAF